MNIHYTGRNCRVGAQLKEAAEARIGKLTKFLKEPVDIHLILEVDKRRRIAELHATHRHGVVQATEEAEQMLEALQAVLDKGEKQARRARKKYKDRQRRAQRHHEEEVHWPLEVIERESVGGSEPHRVIKTTRLPVKPMTIEEAALALDEGKNDFFVFFDSATDQVSVLYKRRDSHLGLIAPEV